MSNIWIPFTHQMPPQHSGFLLVTNNLTARDAFGHHSHIWLVSMVHVHTKPVREGTYTYAEEGEITAFAEPTDRRIRGLTHWRFAILEEHPLFHPHPHHHSEAKDSDLYLFWQYDNPTSLVCGRLHPRHYLEQVLGLHVLEFRGSHMGGFIAVRVQEIPDGLTLPEFIVEVGGWPEALRMEGDQ